MAIDNAEKRKSITALLFISPGVTPNATPDLEWRKQVACLYSGQLFVDLPRGKVQTGDVGIYVTDAQASL